MKIKYIILCEIQKSILSRKFVYTLMICTLLSISSAYLMLQDYKKRLSNAEKSEQVNIAYNSLLSKIVKRPEPLSVLIRGLDELNSSYVTVHGSALQLSIQEPPVTNILKYLFSQPDLTYLVKIVMSLLAIFFAFDIITAEKEGGTLKLMLANNIARSSILFGKILGTLIILVIIFTITLLILLISIAHQLFTFDIELITRILLIYVFSISYIYLFSSLAVFFSTVSYKSSTSLFTSLFVWVCLVFLIPTIMVKLGQRYKPIPSNEQHLVVKSIKIADLKEDLNKNIKKTSNIQESIRIFLGNLVESLERLDEAYLTALTDQIEFTLNILRLSPVASYVNGVTTLASTGISDYLTSRSTVLTHIYESAKNHSGYKPIRFSKARASESFKHALPDLLSLLMFSVLFTVLSIYCFNHYDVR